jgi:hypothetical protein
MPSDIVVDNEFATMWYHPDNKIVHHKIKKFIYGEAFYAFLLSGTDLMKKNHAKKWLSDDRDCPVLRKEDMDWGAQNWFPQTIQAGWKWWAIVTPEKALGQMNLKQLVENYSKAGIIAKFFTSMDEAMKWLESQHD